MPTLIIPLFYWPRITLKVLISPSCCGTGRKQSRRDGHKQEVEGEEKKKQQTVGVCRLFFFLQLTTMADSGLLVTTGLKKINARLHIVQKTEAPNVHVSNRCSKKTNVG